MKKVEKKEFTEAIIWNNTEVVLRGFAEGMPIAFATDMQEDGRRPPMEFASWSKHYEVLHILWQYKAEPATPFIEDIFEKFEAGLLPSELSENDKREKQARLDKVKLDLTDNFSAAKLQLQSIKAKISEHGSKITVKFKPFKIDDYIHENNTLEFVTNDILEVKPQSELVFDNSEGDMKDSIYYDDVHNPVDLKRIKFGEKIGKKIETELELYFDFEFENTPLENETLILTSKIHVG